MVRNDGEDMEKIENEPYLCKFFSKIQHGLESLLWKPQILELGEENADSQVLCCENIVISVYGTVKNALITSWNGSPHN